MTDVGTPIPPESGTLWDDRPLGPYRGSILNWTGVRVSTIVRESSAMAYISPYFETMAFWLDDSKRPAMLWQSAAMFRREADRQHDLAVRWFSRKGVTFSA